MPRLRDIPDPSRRNRPVPPPPTTAPPTPADPVAGLAGALFGPDDDRFGCYLDQLRDHLAAADVEELLFVELIVDSAERLRRARHTEADREPGDAKAHRFRSQATRDLYQAIRELRRLQEQRCRREQEEVERAEDQPPEAIVWVGPEPDVTEPYPRWRERVAMDPAINENWPVVKGTRFRAEAVATEVEEGRAPSEILLDYPGLTPEDIRACVECDRAGKCGPFYADEHPPDAFDREGPVPVQSFKHVPLFDLKNIRPPGGGANRAMSDE